jgi:hypothetical protein
MSLVDRSVARPEAVVQVAKQAARWSEHIPTYTRSKEAGERDGVPLVDLELSLPMLSFSSTYSVSSGPKAVDIWALEGDLRGAHLRWDVQPGQSGLNQIVLRAIQRLDRASLILRQLYKMEPLFEYGINVGLHLVLLNGVKRRAERESGVPAPGSPPPHQ